MENHQPNTNTSEQDSSPSPIPESTQSYKPLSVSIGLLIFRIFISLYAIFQMLWGSGPWGEGRIFYSFISFFGNIIWIIPCLILNIISNKKAPKKQKQIAWILFSIVAFFVILTVVIVGE